MLFRRCRQDANVFHQIQAWYELWGTCVIRALIDSFSNSSYKILFGYPCQRSPSQIKQDLLCLIVLLSTSLSVFSSFCLALAGEPNRFTSIGKHSLSQRVEVRQGAKQSVHVPHCKFQSECEGNGPTFMSTLFLWKRGLIVWSLIGSWPTWYTLLYPEAALKIGGESCWALPKWHEPVEITIAILIYAT